MAYPMVVLQNRFVRSFIFLIGILSVALGFAGIFLPLLPTTPFILLAAWCFLRSSEKAHEWIHRNRFFGPALKSWEKNRSISRKNKVLAVSMMLISLAVLWLTVRRPWVNVAVTAMLATVSSFIVTRNES